MFVKGTASVLLIALSIGIASGIINYCGRDDLCPGEPHITCGATGRFLSNCPPEARDVLMTSQHIDQILNLHNKFRNKIASGNEPGFESAVRMTTMKWNQDLADYAGLNVRRCKARTHDCHNTDEMKYSGQNLNYQASTGDYANPADFIEGSVTVWYNEKQYASQQNIDSCCGGPNLVKKIPHFLEVSLDKADQVGCAMANFPQNGNKITVFTCNYSFTIIQDLKVYVSGPVASECQTGTNPQYPALCSTNESIDPNKVF